MSKPLKYTCNEYREEMMLLGLRRRLNSGGLSEKEEKDLMDQIRKLETRMGL